MAGRHEAINVSRSSCCGPASTRGDTSASSSSSVRPAFLDCPPLLSLLYRSYRAFRMIDQPDLAGAKFAKGNGGVQEMK